MLIAMIPCFNSADTIMACLRSLEKRVDKVICFDVKFTGFPYPNQYSDDETANLINNLKHTGYPVEYICLQSPMYQVEARNEMIKYSTYGDWILFIDSDEQIGYWDNNVKKILYNTNIHEEEESIFNICVEYGDIRHISPTLRLFRNNEETIHYTNNHRLVSSKFGPIDLTKFPLLPIMIAHQPLANEKRMRPYMEQYKEVLKLQENISKEDSRKQ